MVEGPLAAADVDGAAAAAAPSPIPLSTAPGKFAMGQDFTSTRTNYFFVVKNFKC